MTYASALEKIGVNITDTLNRFSGNSGLMEKFIRKFPQDKTIDQLIAAVNAKKYDDIETSAHTLKGISGNLGFTALYESSAALVNAVRAKDFATADNLSPKVIELCKQVNETINSIE